MSHSTEIIHSSLIVPAPELAAVPMMGAVAAKFLQSAKPDVRKMGQEIEDERLALRASFEERGIQDPIPVTVYNAEGVEIAGIDCHPYRLKLMADRHNKVTAWDGRHRLEFANEDGGRNVPVRFVTESVGRSLLEASVIGRRHWTKGQRAWLGVCQHPAVCESTQGSGMAQRSDSVGTLKNADSIGVLTATKLAARIGVSADTVNQAVALYRAFYAPGHAASSPEAIEAAAKREKYEHLIWGGAGLGGILAGIAGGDATGGKPKAQTGFHHLDAPLSQLVRLSKAFTSWDTEERLKAQRLLTARVKADMTPEFRLALAEALAAADE